MGKRDREGRQNGNTVIVVVAKTALLHLLLCVCSYPLPAATIAVSSVVSLAHLPHSPVVAPPLGVPILVLLYPAASSLSSAPLFSLLFSVDVLCRLCRRGCCCSAACCCCLCSDAFPEVAALVRSSSCSIAVVSASASSLLHLL